MTKILSTAQIREADTRTIVEEDIDSIALMERASEAFVAKFLAIYQKSKDITVICGTGNNGGDGLAIARMLISLGYPVEVYVLGGSQGSRDFEINYQQMPAKANTVTVGLGDDCPNFATIRGYIIDAIFGSGLSKPLTGLYAEAADSINAAIDATVISVDIATGLPGDRPRFEGPIVCPHHTVAFQLPKLAFMMPENADYVGQWHTVSIGLSPSYLLEANTPYRMLDMPQIAKMLAKRAKYAHKGHFGRALIVAGEYGKIGAAILAGKAAMRAGAGLLTMHIPECGYHAMQTALPEAMVSVSAHEKRIADFPDLQPYDAIGIGPGLGTHPNTKLTLEQLLSNYQGPIVIDADALNILAANQELLNLLPQGAVLTPHPKEFERLAGKFDNNYDRLEAQMALSKKLQVHIILKGAHTCLTTPQGTAYFNNTGNPGMATAGSGDVLTGIITGLLGQNAYQSTHASMIAMWLHGMAGDIAAYAIGQDAMIASDLIDAMPEAFMKLHKIKQS